MIYTLVPNPDYASVASGPHIIGAVRRPSTIGMQSFTRLQSER
jgi:hypothetical protein